MASQQAAAVPQRLASGQWPVAAATLPLLGRPPPWLSTPSARLCGCCWRWSGDGQEGSTLPAKMAAVR